MIMEPMIYLVTVCKQPIILTMNDVSNENIDLFVDFFVILLDDIL